MMSYAWWRLWVLVLLVVVAAAAGGRGAVRTGERAKCSVHGEPGGLTEPIRVAKNGRGWCNSLGARQLQHRDVSRRDDTRLPFSLAFLQSRLSENATWAHTRNLLSQVVSSVPPVCDAITALY